MKCVAILLEKPSFVKFHSFSTYHTQPVSSDLNLWYNWVTMETKHHPELIHPTAYVAPNATLVGHVHVAAGASIWFSAVLRGDLAPITIGPRTNVQDLTVIHVDEDAPCTVGAGVTIGHRAVLHAATIGDWVLIGMGATVLTGAEVGQEALVGAGGVVTPGMVIPPRHLALGVPARVVRELTTEEIDHLHTSAEQYVSFGRAFAASSEPGERQ